MARPRVVIDTNCLLQILGAKSKYHFLFDSFLQFGYVLCILARANPQGQVTDGVFSIPIFSRTDSRPYQKFIPI